MGGGGTTTQTTTQELSPEQRKLLEPVIPIATDILKPGAVKLYPGSGIAAQTPAEQQAQQMALQAAGGMQSVTSQLPGQITNIQNGQAGNVDQVGQQAQQGQSQLMQMIASMFGGTSAQINQGNAATQPALSTLMDPNILNADSNPYLQSYMSAALHPLESQFSTQIMPGISSDAITAGGFGGSRQGIAQGLAAQGLQQSSGDIVSKIASEGYGQGLTAMIGGVNAANTQQGNTLNALGQMFGQGIQGVNANTANNLTASNQKASTLAQMMQGLSATPDILASMTKPAEVVSAVGAQQRAEEQAKLTEAVQRFSSEQMLPFTLAQQVAQMAYGMPGGSTTSTGTTTGGSSQTLGQIMGGVSALPALLGLFGLSDRKLKENIEYLRTLSDGVRVYAYNFIGKTKRQFGVMADEILAKYPTAVMCGDDGYLRVNYFAIPTWKEAF